MPHPSAPSLRGATTVFVVKDVLRSVAIHFQAASESKRQPGHDGRRILSGFRAAVTLVGH